MNALLAYARIIPTLYATLPPSFEERVAGRMAYEIEGNKVHQRKA